MAWNEESNGVDRARAILTFCGGLLGAWACAFAAPAGPVALMRDGKPAAAIVVADQPVRIPLQMRGRRGREDLTVLYAAEELQRFIEKASGARLPILPAAKAPAQDTLVLVGRSELSRKLGLKCPTAPEALRIATFGRGVAILGEVAPKGTDNVGHEVDRGTLHGVYDFLERIVGCRFYIQVKAEPDMGTVVPSIRDVSVPAGYALKLAPDFPFRSGGFATCADRPDWMRVTREGAGTGFVGANHTDSGCNRWRKEHPEWFALRKDGTRDARYLGYSAPGVIERRIEVIQECYANPKRYRWYGEHCPPGPKYITFVPADVFSWRGRCYCERCSKAFQEERGRFGKFSNIIFRYGVRLAEEIRKRWPEKRLAMLAYEGYMLLRELDLPGNLDVQVCMMWSSTVGKEGDRLGLTLKKGQEELLLTLDGEGSVQGTLEASVVQSGHANGIWTVHAKFPAAVLGLGGGKAGELLAQIERVRAHRGKGRRGRGTHYYWMPPMKPPWGPQFRFGRLQFEATK